MGAFRHTRFVSGTESSADLRITGYQPDPHLDVSAAPECITVTYRYRPTLERDGARLG